MHPKAKEAYSQAGFDIPPTPQEANELVFRRKTKRAKEGEIKKFINQVWRISKGGKEEFIIYEQKEVGADLAGNEDTFTSMVGRYDMPKFRKVYNNVSGEVDAVNLSGTETVYEIPYSKKNMEEVLNSGNSDNTAFTLWAGNRKYGGFTRDDFVDKSLDELIGIDVAPPPSSYQEQERPVRRAPPSLQQQKRRQQQQKRKQQTTAAAQEEDDDVDDKPRPTGLSEREQGFRDNRPAAATTTKDKKSAAATTTAANKPDEVTRIQEDVNYVIKKEDEEA